MSTVQLPIAFRAAEVNKILAALLAGESCSIVGIGSVGKSNLLRFLQQKIFQLSKKDSQWSNYRLIYIDSNKLIELSTFGLYELMLFQLRLELERQGCDLLLCESLDSLHADLFDEKGQSLALRYLERGISLACDHLNYKIVFLIDEFDTLCQSLSSRTFSAFRALRDDYKYRLMYVVASRKNIHQMSKMGLEIEDFEELITPNTIYLSTYSEYDARNMISRLSQRYGVILDEEKQKEILLNSGGHPGLIKALFIGYLEDHQITDKNSSDHRQVDDECQRIWHCLSNDQQKEIVSLIENRRTDSQNSTIRDHLIQIGIIGGPWVKSDEIFSPKFTDFVKNKNPMVGAKIRIDHKGRNVFVNGFKMGKLAPLEYKLMEVLDEKRNQVVTRDEIAAELYPDDLKQDGKGVSDERIDAVIKRLRQALEPECSESHYIITVRGHGIQLIDGVE